MVLARVIAMGLLPLAEVPPPCTDEPFVWCNTTGFATLLLK